MYYGTIRGPKYEIVPLEGNITIIVRFQKHITTKYRPHMEYRILEGMVLLAHPGVIWALWALNGGPLSPPKNLVVLEESSSF